SSDYDFLGRLHYPRELALEVLVAYLNGRKVTRLLNPHSFDGLLTAEVLNAVDACGCTEVIADGLAQKMSELLNEQRQVERLISVDFDPSGTDDPDFDLIVSYLLPQGKQHLRVLHVAGEDYTLRDYSSSFLIMQSCFLLADIGEAIFLTDENFLNHSPDSVMMNLHRVGLYLKAAIAFPSSTSSSGESETLIFISKSPQKNMFVGNPEGLLEVEPLVENLRNREEGASPNRGRLVDTSGYYGWNHFDVCSKVAYDAAGRGYRVVSLAEIASRITVIDDDLINDNDITPNSFGVKIDEDRTAIIDVKAQAASSEYIAHFLGSEDAYAASNTLMYGIPRKRLCELGNDVVKNLISGFQVGLPSVEIQKHVVETRQTISTLAARLRHVRQDVWDNPWNARSLKNDLDAWTGKNLDRSWTGSLPFPLASVLHQYEATSKISKKIDYLKDFFEACGTYLFTVLFSAVNADHELYNKERDEWRNRKAGVPLRILQFGALRTFTKDIARLVKGKIDADPSYWTPRLFGTRDTALVYPLIKKSVYDALFNAASFRNARAHGPTRKSNNEEKEILERGERYLETLRTELDDVFSRWQLISPESCVTRHDDTFCICHSLQGSNPFFADVERKTNQPGMNTDDLYLFADGSITPIRLVPFVRLLQVGKGERNTIYFYSKLENGQMNWVSYHCPGESERLDSIEEIDKILDDLCPRNY
ncbi:MAG: hypothetical protein ACYC0V_22125, partial [Armatimonadota bacterium]